MDIKRHLYFSKENIKVIEKFPKRSIPPKKVEDDELPKNYEPKKEELRKNLFIFRNEIDERHRNRTIEVSRNIDLIKIYFHGVLNQDLQKKFSQKYGLTAIKFESYNKVVLFAIRNVASFNVFIKHLEKFINLKVKENPLRTELNLLVHINRFELLSSEKIIKAYSGESIVIDIIDNNELINEINLISKDLILFLNKVKNDNLDFDFSFKPEYSFIDLKNVPRGLINDIVDNFDIVHRVQSYSFQVCPRKVGTVKRLPGFEVQTDERASIIGVLDTGVQQSSVLRNIIRNYQYDISNSGAPLPVLDMEGHGTAVACIAALGKDFYFSDSSNLIASALITPIKIIESSTGTYSFTDFENVIRDAAAKGIKIFNLSIVSSLSKFYNEAVTEHAYLLDRLSHELDILFVIAVGNLNYDDMAAMKDKDVLLHKYPNHYYNPGLKSDEHTCECINICSPAESFNNISVGAIADNFEKNRTDLTLDKELPAYYSRKFHLDYSEKINGFNLSQSQINENINKPDVVFAGGDAIEINSGLEILSIIPGQLTQRSYGTSNSAPFISNLAARILREYTNLKTQTVKALIINSASLPYNSKFLKGVIEDIKIRYFSNNYNEDSIADLSNSERLKLSRMFKAERLLKNIAGHGIPDHDMSLYSQANSVTMILEEKIKTDTHKGIIINFPEYLTTNIKQVLEVNATLCFSFEPIFNNFLSYCPIHISFALFKPLNEDVNKSIDIIAGYTRSEKKNDSEKIKLAEYSTEKAFKSGIKWSDDYSPRESRPFSNTQKIRFLVTKENLESIDNKLNLVVRCTSKQNIDPEILNKINNNEHKFSIVIRVDEKEIESNLSNNLYDEMIAINDLDSLITIDNDVDIELSF